MPIIVGVIRPVILLPVSIVTELSPLQIEAVLAHELAHIRRWDHFGNLVQRIIESLLFFHPAVWYVSRCVSHERENSCDDVVVAHGTEATSYAELLIRVSELSQTWSAPSAAVLAATGTKPTHLRQRIIRLLNRSTDTPIQVSRAGFATVSALILCAVVTSTIIRAHGADRGVDQSHEFVHAHIYYRSGDTEHFRKIRVGATGTTCKKLLHFFPKVGEGKSSYDSKMWNAPLIVDLERRDKTRHRVTCDLSQYWSEGNGNRPLEDAEGLRRFLGNTYYPRRYVRWVKSTADGWVELQAICRAPFGRDRWWGPEGIGCGFVPDAREQKAATGKYMICIQDFAGEGDRKYEVPGASIVNVHKRPGSALIQFQPTDQTAKTMSLRVGIQKSDGWQIVEFQNIRLKPDEEGKHANPMVAHRAGFGPIFIRQLTQELEISSAYLNLKSGNHVKPTNLHPLNVKAFQKAGVDLFHSMIQSNIDQCLCRDMDVVEVKDGWKLTAQQVDKTLEQARQQGKSNKNVAPVGTFLNPNITYVFQTRDGSRGILELILDKEYTGQKRVRYKLVAELEPKTSARIDVPANQETERPSGPKRAADDKQAARNNKMPASANGEPTSFQQHGPTPKSALSRARQGWTSHTWHSATG